jgi:hypothetical protein
MFDAEAVFQPFRKGRDLIILLFVGALGSLIPA